MIGVELAVDGAAGRAGVPGAAAADQLHARDRAPAAARADPHRRPARRGLRHPGRSAAGPTRRDRDPSRDVRGARGRPSASFTIESPTPCVTSSTCSTSTADELAQLLAEAARLKADLQPRQRDRRCWPASVARADLREAVAADAGQLRGGDRPARRHAASSSAATRSASAGARASPTSPAPSASTSTPWCCGRSSTRPSRSSPRTRRVPGHQRPVRPVAPVPGAGRPADDPARCSASSRAGRWRSSATATTWPGRWPSAAASSGVRFVLACPDGLRLRRAVPASATAGSAAGRAADRDGRPGARGRARPT